MEVMPVFDQKLLNTQHGVGRYAGKSPIMKWANMLKESMAAGTLIQMAS